MKQTFLDLQMDSHKDNTPMSRYPRPSLVRDSFYCLNGVWEDGVCVPYPLESRNSGFDGTDYTHHEYYRHFTVKSDFSKEGDRVLLHFGAVDQQATVLIDDVVVGSHAGGYLPFEIDITDYIKKDHSQLLTVKTTDDLSPLYPLGKQRTDRGGMWYTPVSGIWGSVWIESVPSDYIKSIEITPSLKGITLNIDSEALNFDVEIYARGSLIFKDEYDDPYIHIDINDPVLWTPDNPFLYDIIISTPTDRVKSYFGLRTVTIRKVNGVPRILLNEKPFFFHGVLDQGYFPEGIYTPNTESDYEEDIMRLKSLGINTIRKHIKIEPECFYEACDRLGMLVFQDMVNNGKYSFFRDTALPTIGIKNLKDTKRRIDEEVKECFEASMEETLAHLYNFPCVVYYTIFNEGWGQFDSDIMYQIATAMDPSRIYDSTSGWFWQDCSDVDSYHVYFRHFKEFKPSMRPVILSEFGGFSLKIKEHSFNQTQTYGYGKAKNSDTLTDMIRNTYETDVIPYIPQGLCGTIYTQATDVEDETNGFYTYDRKICKVNTSRMQELAEILKSKL